MNSTGIKSRCAHLRFDFVSEQEMVEVARHAELVDGERLHRLLHAVERRALPHEVDAEARRLVHRRALPKRKHRLRASAEQRMDSTPRFSRSKKRATRLNFRVRMLWSNPKVTRTTTGP